MTRHAKHTAYCDDPICSNAGGVEIAWYPDSLDGPAYPYTDSCPKCGADLTDEPHPEPIEYHSEEPE